MEKIKGTIFIVISLFLGFFIWYLVFFFLTGESNPIEWSITAKIFYLIFGYATSGGILEGIFEMIFN